jgi:LIVCS family branched-chain amino acid:cation transporter
MFKRFFNSEIITTGLAIFSMFFGAGNLMFPIKVGLMSGDKNFFGMIGFLFSGVLIPLVALVTIILFQGDYKQFFYRLGRIPGFLFILFCMSVVGPLIIMPRIVALSYVTASPFMPGVSLFVFSILFLTCTFLATYKENRIVDILGYVISPLLLASLIIIIVKGYFTGITTTINPDTSLETFTKSFIIGYKLADILAGIFFCSIVITILQKNNPSFVQNNFKKLAVLSFKAGMVGLSLLALIYIGLSYLGAYHGHGLEFINEGELFSTISFRVLGSHGAAIIALAVLMACYSTIIALTAVFADFLNTQLCNNKLGYIPAVVITLLLTLIPANFGLGFILGFSGPIIVIIYPALIALVFTNLAYKLFNFQWIKLPVAITLLVSFILYFR